MSKKTSIQFSKQFHIDVMKTWDYIGSDVMDLEDVDNEVCVECVLDAQRIRDYGSQASLDEFEQLCDKHGFSDVFKAACKTFSLY